MLNDALRAIAEEDRRMNTSPWVEASLRLEVEAIQQARRFSRWKMSAAAAVLIVAVGAAVWSVGRPFTRRQTQVAAVETTTDFFPLHYSNVPAADVQLVRLEVPRTALASFGLATGDSPPNIADATVLADVIVGSDGLARAIRFVDVGAP